MSSRTVGKGLCLRIWIATFSSVAIIALTGCSTMNDSDDRLDHTPETREISDARAEVRNISAKILELINLHGKVSDRGPGVSECSGKDPGRFYSIHHRWSVTDVPVGDMKKAMASLKADLPKHGWKIFGYGPDKSPSKSLKLVAEFAEKRFFVNIHLYDESGRAKPDGPKSKIFVDLLSECFQVPKGKTVDEY
ncbi:hypothetical protein [Streptomyces sp. MST-110588]|uniref:hypothetical protein n=1 Tax=Streptomyces sp. MST-110588 TaxID=2833628 RepID=UPI001F5C5292|nr:hypothetical protein [Streptomyces sp. MST-110588]UNO41061.1 hypothetical protein KGS77_17535 [Streptomyces sp. MST-110588]